MFLIWSSCKKLSKVEYWDIWLDTLKKIDMSNFPKFQAPNEKGFNIKLVSLYRTFPKISNSFILDLKCIGCSWLKQADIIWHGSNFKWQCTIALHFKLASTHLIIHFGLQAISSWAYACPCTMISSFAKFGRLKRVCKYHMDLAINTVAFAHKSHTCCATLNLHCFGIQFSRSPLLLNLSIPLLQASEAKPSTIQIKF